VQVWIGVQIDFDIPKRVLSLKLKPEVDSDPMAATLKNRYDVIIPPDVD